MKILLLVIFLLSCCNIYSQNLSKFEPPDGRVLHGLGHYAGFYYTDQEYWDLVSEYQTAAGKIPAIYSVYTFIDPYLNSIDHTDFQDIVNNHNYPYILLIGLSYHDSTLITEATVNLHIEDILNGDLDNQIIALAQKISALNSPVFLRPGFEFGESNAGIHNDRDMTAQKFKDIWIHIYQIFIEQNVTNVAWVWNTVNPHMFNYMDWYPGDGYVDWWGINYFTKSQITNSDGFLDSAVDHNRPIMICESNPIQNNGTTSSLSWNEFFVPYFNKIKSYPDLKAFVYIHNPWDMQPFLDWPDSRINSNSTIQNNYSAELEDNIYIHMDEYQNNPSIINFPDNSLPVELSEFNAAFNHDKILITWKTESETNNLGFNIYRAFSDIGPESFNTLNFVKINELIIPGVGTDSHGKTYIYSDENIPVAKYYYYYLEDISFDGEGTLSDTISVKQIEKTGNPVIFKNYPNPFNSSTSFFIQLPFDSEVEVEIFNLLGEKITSFKRSLSLSKIEIKWQASGISSGVYIARLKIVKESSLLLKSLNYNPYFQTIKILLIN